MPFLETQRAIVLLLDPVGDAVEVEGMIAVSPGDVACAFVLRHVRHAVDAVLHEVVAANTALVLLDLPLPHDDCIPFLDDKILLGRLLIVS